ncbi:MAG: hypothetical protein JXR68_13350 [Bacteroidales bacterium]|nr:hypothetical protein [Bacteroidales bacterium]
MINKNYINTLLKDIITDDIYIVEVKISNAPKISLFIDSFKGVTIRECQIIHKKLASEIREKTDDFLLDVSSPGITSNLIVWQQYFKLKNKKINLTTLNGENFDCLIEEADEKKVILQLNNDEKVPFEYEKIKKAKPIFEF